MGSSQSSFSIYRDFAENEDAKKLVLDKMMNHKYTLLTKVEVSDPIREDQSVSRKLNFGAPSTSSSTPKEFVKVSIFIEIALAAEDEDFANSDEFKFMILCLRESFFEMFKTNGKEVNGFFFHPIRNEDGYDHSSIRTYFKVPTHAFAGLSLEDAKRRLVEEASINILKNYALLEKDPIMKIAAQIGEQVGWREGPVLDIFFADRISILNFMSSTSLMRGNYDAYERNPVSAYGRFVNDYNRVFLRQRPSPISI
tara:strand:- start:854 stop:1615 length:762 start_codon:yes stop_codon:yes gene_type:complete